MKPRRPQRAVRRPTLRTRVRATAAPAGGGEESDFARLAHEAAPSLEAEQLTRLLRYLNAMLERNQHVNLTAIRDPARARVLHVLDSLQLWHAHAAPQLVLDLGTGNGFPGAAAAALWPGANVLLVDRTQKKVRAVADCLQSAGLTNAEALAADAEQLPSLRPGLKHKAQLVSLRAVAPLATCLRLAAPFLAKDGVVAVFKASALDAQEAEEGARQARSSGLRALEEWQYVLPGEERRERRLLRFARR